MQTSPTETDHTSMRIGLAGAGRIGARHATTLASLPAVDRVVVSDPDRTRAAEVADRTGAVVVDGVAELLAGVDALVVATPTEGHAPLIRRAAALGLPTFCEKPVAAGLAETRDLVAAVADADLVLQVGFQRRFDAGFRALRDAVRAGTLGRVHTLRGCTSDPAPPPAAYIAGSGGIFRDCAVHDYDAVRWVTGREVVAVSATGANTGAEFFAAAGDVDTAVSVLTLSDGALAVCTATRYNGAGYDVRLEAHGSAGTLVAGLDARSPLPSADLGTAPAEPYAGFADRFAEAYVAELSAFVALAGGDGENPCPGTEALAALLVAEAAERSRREQRPVRLEELS
ncbi:Gfo/Idh/MocA family protein [Actinocatenispora rupis]